MNRFDSIPAQLRRNFVALISLVVAITSLGYNTWRNEASEYNRNQRLISIEVLRNLSDLFRTSTRAGLKLAEQCLDENGPRGVRSEQHLARHCSGE